MTANSNKMESPFL